MVEQIHLQMRAMQALSKSQDMTADNLANLNTPGFKGNKIFYELYTEEVDGKRISQGLPMQTIDMSQGVLEGTGNSFDIAIEGDGFFTVQEGDRTYLTRNGRFHLDNDGVLVDDKGNPVLGTNGLIELKELVNGSENSDISDFKVSQDGTIYINGNEKSKIAILKPAKTSDLERHGNGYFKVDTIASLSSDDSSKVHQGFYEKGNVQPLNEMVDMMQTMQLFESQQKAMRTTDELLGKITSQLGRY